MSPDGPTLQIRKMKSLEIQGKIIWQIQDQKNPKTLNQAKQLFSA